MNNMKMDLSEMKPTKAAPFAGSAPLTRSAIVPVVQPKRDLGAGMYTMPKKYTSQMEAVPFPGCKDCT
jgi:hypothetical protein